MSKSSSGGISISTIVMLIFLYNFLFDDDDSDKKDAEVHDSTESAIVEKSESEPSKGALQKLYEQAKKEYDEAITDERKAELKRGLEQLEEELGIKKEEEPELVMEQKEEDKTYLQAPPKDGELKPLDEGESNDEGMQRL